LFEQRLREKGSANTTWVAGNQRFRVSVFYTRQQLAFVFRYIPPGIRYFSSLSLPPVVFTSLLERAHRGLFLLAGPAGSGKSTTLSACIQFWNHHTAQHIIAIEDPIEYIHESARSLIHQIEVGNDTLSFTDALHSALRQSPQIIVVGEIRSEDTARLALQAAETGHLVAGTIHAPHTFGALRRFTGFFPEVEQSRIWNRLVETFVAVISQVLLPAETSAGSDDASPGVTLANRIPAIEILRSSFHIRQLLNSPHCTRELITEAMERARDEYMINLDDYLYLLVCTQRIRLETALTVAHSPSDLKLRAVSQIEKF
jgi:pilus retraction protein PilT